MKSEKRKDDAVFHLLQRPVGKDNANEVRDKEL
jgi:hypothetical protein